jgi:hypothetical protein
MIIAWNEELACRVMELLSWQMPTGIEYNAEKPLTIPDFPDSRLILNTKPTICAIKVAANFCSLIEQSWNSIFVSLMFHGS